MTFKNVFKHWKTWLLITFLVFAIISLHPNPWASGAAIRSVQKDSAAQDAGFINPKPTSPPMTREVIKSINNVPIHNVADYNTELSKLVPNSTISITTNKDIYRLIVRSDNKTGNIDLGLKVYDAPKSNIRMGLDLQGGTRVVLKPEGNITESQLESLVDGMKQRLNVYGLSDIIVRTTKDLDGKDFIIVEIAGATDDEVRDLLSRQGKFEGKIGNDTSFSGGTDIKYVCKTADCARIMECNKIAESQNMCRFSFAISLSPESAQRQAELTKDLDVVISDGEGFLSKDLDLYLDDELVDSLRIGESLKGRAETQISISGSGVGLTQDEAMQDAVNNMKRLQTILITGSLPVKLTIIESSNISPTLGNEFIGNTLFVGLIVLILVVLLVMIRYKQLIVSVPVIITLISEVVILLGFAALIGWNIDLIAIAAIIIAIGTGIDSQLVIIDEITGHKDSTHELGWKDRIKNAFFIVYASYFTLVVAMIPLIFAGAGLLKGFALTTILGVSIGVFITRPAFTVIAENLLKHRKE